MNCSVAVMSSSGPYSRGMASNLRGWQQQQSNRW
jgi:hypothetical protein